MQIFKNLFLIVLMVLLYACTTNEKKVAGTDTAISDFKQSDTALTFGGYWVNEYYDQEVRKTGSPRAAQDSALFIYIPNNTQQQTAMIYGFHEGGDLLKVFKNGKSYELWEVQGDSLLQCAYKIQVVAPNRIKLNHTYFVKTDIVNKEDEQKVLEHILFKGQYTNASGDKIEFKSNGQLVGLKNYKYYEPVIDYYDAGMDVDEMSLGTAKEKMEHYAFKFKKDTLELYKRACLEVDESDKSCVKTGYGQLVYKLWRK